MADKFTLRGVKRIESYTEPAATADRLVTLKRPTTGKDQYTIKRWWTEQGSRIPKRYVNVTAFDIARTGDDVVLAVVSNQDTRLDVIFNDPSTFTFGEIHSVDRIGIFNSDMSTLYVDYAIPKVSGVAPYANVISPVPAPITIGTVTVSGPTTASSGVATAAYTATLGGNATSAQVDYQWSSTDGTAAFGSATAASTTVTFNATGSFTVSCQVTGKGGQGVTDGPTAGTSASVTVS